MGFFVVIIVVCFIWACIDSINKEDEKIKLKDDSKKFFSTIEENLSLLEKKDLSVLEKNSYITYKEIFGELSFDPQVGLIYTWDKEKCILTLKAKHGTEIINKNLNRIKEMYFYALNNLKFASEDKKTCLQSILFANVISDFDTEYFDKKAKENNLENYSFVTVSRSTTNIKPGAYIYKILENYNIHFLSIPLVNVKKAETEYMILDPNFNFSAFIIEYSKVRDFQVFGSEVNAIELIASTATTNNNSIIGNAITESFFGTAATLLKNFQIPSYSIKNSIQDTRKVQIILEDNTDIEFIGVNIFYDLNRFYGKIANNRLKLHMNKESEQIYNKEIENKSKNYIEELKGLKELLDLNIITRNEFEEKKSKLLNIKDETDQTKRIEG